jgi:tetratricopeptide (TPR) repeat protein
MGMINRTALRTQAKELRLASNFKEALPLYLKLWDETKVEIDAAGILHCLRKEKEYEKAIAFSLQLASGPYQKDWLRNELVWTYIEGRLLKKTTTDSLTHLIDAANKVLDLKPDLIALKTAVFVILKAAKQHDRWDIVDEWVGKIDPTDLSDEPNVANGRMVWSDQGSWYNYRIRCLIELNQSDKALELSKQIEDRFPRERKFFLRLRGLAYYKLHFLSEAAEIYKLLCSAPTPDWWLLHEYSSVIHAIARKKNDATMMEQALRLMYQAASIVTKTNKLESMLKLLSNIAEICQELKQAESVLPHLLLISRIREDNNWPVPQQVTESIHRLSSNLGNELLSKTKRDILAECQKTWRIAAAHETTNPASIKTYGKIILGPPNRHYCFIIAEDKHCFCPKNKLPPGLKDGDEVNVEIVSSFDSKKKQDGWKAVKVWKA